MALGRQGERQTDLMIGWAELPRSPGHAFYDRLQASSTSRRVTPTWCASGQAVPGRQDPTDVGSALLLRCHTRQAQSDISPPCHHASVLSQWHAAWVKRRVHLATSGHEQTKEP